MGRGEEVREERRWREEGSYCLLLVLLGGEGREGNVYRVIGYRRTC